MAASYDLLIKGGRLVTSARTCLATVAVRV